MAAAELLDDVSLTPTTAPAPVSRAERLTALDTLRGFALLGILLMNIVGFGLYGAAYGDPTVAGGATGINAWVWAVLHVLAEGKMRCLFSMIFGASVVLLTERLEGSGQSADIYYRRTLWLLLFGVAHAYLLWMGDILYPYALCALALYPFRKLSARKLLIIGIVIALVDSGAYFAASFKTRAMLERGHAALDASARGQKLSEEQEQAKRQYEDWRQFFRPTADELKKDAEAWRGSFASVVAARAKIVAYFHGKPYYSPFSGNTDFWCMMFIGMGLFKLGVFSAQRSAKFYAWMVLLGFGIGVPLNSYSAWTIVNSNFDPVVHSFANTPYNLGRLSVALGFVAVMMLLVKSGWLRWLTASLSAVGQMAFSNYILQSVICSLVFTGYGLALYGRMQRYQLYYVAGTIWILQLIASPLWLRHFRMGPLEWCWRSLTCWKRQPMRLGWQADLSDVRSYSDTRMLPDVPPAAGT